MIVCKLSSNVNSSLFCSRKVRLILSTQCSNCGPHKMSFNSTGSRASVCVKPAWVCTNPLPTSISVAKQHSSVPAGGQSQWNRGPMTVLILYLKNGNWPILWCCRSQWLTMTTSYQVVTKLGSYPWFKISFSLVIWKWNFFSIHPNMIMGIRVATALEGLLL